VKEFRQSFSGSKGKGNRAERWHEGTEPGKCEKEKPSIKLQGGFFGGNAQKIRREKIEKKKERRRERNRWRLGGKGCQKKKSFGATG